MAHTHTRTHLVTEPCNNFAMIVCGRVFVNEGVWIMLLLLGGWGVLFNLVTLVDKWSLALGKRRVCANSWNSSPHSCWWCFCARTLHTRIQQIRRAPKQTGQTFPAYWENTTSQRVATPGKCKAGQYTNK